MGEGNSKRSKPSAWSLPSSSKLEADIAYFEARLSMLDEKPATCYQNAQRRAYAALENSLAETLERLRAQQRRRRKIKASSEVPLADQLDQTDIQSLLAEEAMQSLEKAETDAESAEQEKVVVEEPAVSPPAPDQAEANPGADDEAVVPEGGDDDEQRGEGSEFPESSQELGEDALEQEAMGQFDSDNLYLRTALFSEHLSFLQEPEEVEEEWEDVGEAEIRENLGQLDMPEEPNLVDAGESMPLDESEPREPENARPKGERKGSPDDDEDYSDSFFDSWLKE